MLCLQEFIKNNDDWEELLKTDPYNLKITRDDCYIIFKYNQLSSDFNLPLVRECRGIILREADYKVVCHAFDKFGNYGESYCPEIDWNTASVQQKIDGSLMKVWYDNDKWHVSTNGTIDAFKAELPSCDFNSYGDLFVNELQHCGEIDSFDKLCNYLDEDYTYMFELVTKYNRVVVPADNYDGSIYLLGARNNITSEEDDLQGTLLSQLLYTPHRYDLHSLKDVQQAAAELPWDEEGYVVCDGHFNRVKIKSPEYIKAHYMRSNNTITWERLIDVILTGEETEFLIYAAEYKEKLLLVKAAISRILKEVKTDIENMKPELYESRKDFALEVQKKESWKQPFLYK